MCVEDMVIKAIEQASFLKSNGAEFRNPNLLFFNG